MLSLEGKKYNIEANTGTSIRKIGIVFLSLTTALALSACGSDNQQAQALGTDSAGAATSNADSFEYALPKQVAETIDAFDSPSISIQTLHGTLTMADDGKAKLEAEDGGDSSDLDIDVKGKGTSKDSKASKDSKTSKDSKKKQGTKSKVGSAKSKAGVSSTKAITTGDVLSSTPKADGALADDSLTDDPLTDDPLTADIDPTVNSTNESPDAKSDVQYSMDDDPPIQQSNPETSANSGDPTPSSDIIAVFE